MRYIQLGCLMMISTCAYAQTYAQTEKGIVLKDSISAESNHIIDSQKPFEMAKDSIDIKPDLTLPYMLSIPKFRNVGVWELCPLGFTILFIYTRRGYGIRMG